MKPSVFVFSYACSTSLNCDVYHRLSLLGYSVTIYIPKTIPNMLRSYGKCKLKYVHSLLTHPRLHTNFSFLLEIVICRPNLIILEQDIISLNVILAYILSRFTHSKLFVQTYQNINPLSSDSNKFFEHLTSRILFLIYQVFSCLPDCIITVSRNSFLFFNSLGFSNVYLLPLGVNNSHFRKMTLRRSSILNKFTYSPTSSITELDDGKILLGFVGRIVPEKGVHYILELLRRLPSKYILLLDSFQSKSEYESYLNDLISNYGLSHRIVFFHCAHSMIHLVYNALDYVLCPSISSSTWSEQYGRVPVEASFCDHVPLISKSGHFSQIPISRHYITPTQISETDLNAASSMTPYFTPFLTTQSMALRIDKLFRTSLCQ